MRIAIFGTVGSGKSTISTRLGKKLGYEIFLEPYEENPYWKHYYKNLKKWALQFQLAIIMKKTKRLIDQNKYSNIIYDRTILEDPIFVQVQEKLNIIDRRDSVTYHKFFNNTILDILDYHNKLNYDLIVYLKVSDEKSLQRIVSRGREQEQSVGKHYWKMINEHYEKYYLKYKNKYRFLVIDANNDNIDEKVDLIIREINK